MNVIAFFYQKNCNVAVIKLFVHKYCLEVRPCPAVVLDAVAAGVWGGEGLLSAAVELALGGVDGVGVGFACGLVLDGIPRGAVEAHAGEPFGACEYYLAFGVVPGVVFVLLQYGKLYGVYHLQILEAETECHRRYYVYLHQRLPPLKIVAQRDVPLPLRGECGEWFEAAVADAPCLLLVLVAPHLLPKVGVMFGKAVEKQGAAVEGGFIFVCYAEGEGFHPSRMNSSASYNFDEKVQYY